MRHARTALREAALTNAARPWRLVVSVLLLAPLLLVPAALELTAAVALDKELSSEEALGRDVLVVEREGGVLDGARCEAVGSQDGVLDAGGVSEPEVVGVGTDALISTRRVTATPGYLRALGYETSSAEAIAGFALSKELSIQDGAIVSFSDGSRARMSIAVDSPRAEARSRWITVPAAALDAVRECWVTASPSTLAAVQAAIPSFFPTATDLRVSTLRTDRLSKQAIATWEDRPTRWLFAAAGASAALLVGVMLWPRRHEYALCRLLGMSRPVVMLLAAAEAMLLVTASALLATPYAVAVMAFLGGIRNDYAQVVLVQGMLALAVLTVLVAPVTAWVSSGRPADVLRERA